ncbi:30S ribosomal protein S20 [Lentilactobacillus kefiri]|jgi:small subunit ribosomal protein S20|uniref:Small ribosomal subunit protein bS20 n=2 Tax=Lentilactobacillus kefiri TaxID=33962 RepID=A0A8E1V295_LENKE|nr:30S ribosomal protein S20 [Lentilactobacillus kefiri]KRL57626.1 30S ribosomal protein S20 [Lentilactobacillus parakefiri DSM 10551]KRM52209.1 30S ribosomal protein S20 [Lentilactobacillus kefiri DSM 20587 = JCM 5818]MCJ2162337.1 30S ribosomal protein S20 [Lentilactobacillus kefiri]MCP9368230.1 30S ribosomal protein S20 [Lentilactobacillus kefiri]MDH5108997.1 30S ribosomal protein S20 [Lentilactobacillus kefiri]
MPIIKSAIERVKTNEKAQRRNAAQLSAYRTAVKKFQKAQVAGSDDAKDLYINAISAIDHAKSKGLIKANKAARDKSRLTSKLAK